MGITNAAVIDIHTENNNQPNQPNEQNNQPDQPTSEDILCDWLTFLSEAHWNGYSTLNDSRQEKILAIGKNDETKQLHVARLTRRIIAARINSYAGDCTQRVVFAQMKKYKQHNRAIVDHLLCSLYNRSDLGDRSVIARSINDLILHPFHMVSLIDTCLHMFEGHLPAQYKKTLRSILEGFDKHILEEWPLHPRVSFKDVNNLLHPRPNKHTKATFKKAMSMDTTSLLSGGV